MRLVPASLAANWIEARRWDREGYTFEPLGADDIEPVRQWRNAQLDVLRQSTPLSPHDQHQWFEHTVRPMHAGPDPSFLLVAVRRDARLVAYGGVTNLSWGNLRAEVSFLADTARAADGRRYAKDFGAFLRWLDLLAFGELGLNRLFTETYAFRAGHIGILEAHGFAREGRMRSHVVKRGEPVDSLIHGRLRGDL